MKKTNLFKKMTSLFLAIMMLMSVVPMMASAEVSDGKFWLTLGMTTFDDYVEVSRSAGTYVAKKSDNSGWLYQTAGNNKYKDVFASTNSSMRLHHGTGVRAFADTDFYEAAPVIEGAGELTIYGRLNRGWSNSSPSWYAGDGKGSPDSIIMVSDLFDKADVKVGDTVKITAWVNSVYPQSATSSDDNIEGGAGEVPADATATVSMWVADKATDGTVGTAAADYHLTPVTDASWTDAVTHKNLTYGQWQALSLTYTVTDANKGASGIALNSDLLGTTEKVTSFPLELHVAAVKAEKLSDCNGKYTYDDGRNYETISTVTLEDYAIGSTQTENQASTWWGGTATIDGRVSNIRMAAGSMDYYPMFLTQPRNNYPENKRIHHQSGLKSIGSYSWPDGLGTQPESAKILELNRSKVHDWAVSYQSAPSWCGLGYGDPNSSIAITNIFDEADVQIGDTIRITAYVYGKDMRAVTEPADGVKYALGELDSANTTETVAPVRMWLSEDTATDFDGLVEDDIVYNNLEPNAARSDEMVETTMSVDKWNKISIVYTVDETNKNISSIKIDNDNSTHDVDVFPFYLSLAGVTVEKVASIDSDRQGKVAGTVVAAPATVETGADYRVLVGAYKKVGDVYMMLGCNILPYEADCSYDFVINDAEGATDVFAYLWDFNAYEPQIVPIECTYIAQ